MVFDEHLFEVKTEEEYMKHLSPDQDDDREFIQEIDDLPKPDTTKEFQFIWLVRLFPGEALKQLHDENYVFPSEYARLIQK